ncbi:TRAP transporter large permease [Sporosarcina sp. FSL K6-3508]|uniref:TRAP transporter large permease n=1 Tax=Sporosarcina sp. FSL K6-3508 TaxID=2921557 RepID=UPI003159F9E6
MLAILFISLFILLLLGMDISLVMLSSAALVVIFSQFSDFPLMIQTISQHIFSGVDKFSFTAIPLFILAGELMNRGMITDRLVTFSQTFLGHVPGGLAQTGVGLNVVMAGMSGSAVADCASTGSILIPAMEKEGYKPARAAAIIANASTIGPVFPPSIPMIIIGSIAGLSVGKLFIAGVVPGLLMGIALMFYIYFHAKKTKMAIKQKSTIKEKIAATRNAFLALLLPVIIVGSIIFGIASPTESAVLGVLYALIVTTFVYRTMSFKNFYETLIASSVSAGVIMLVSAAGVLFGWLATYYNLGNSVRDLLFLLSDNTFVVLIVVNIMLLILGMVLEAIPIILLSVPVLLPLLTELGIDPIHASMIIVVNLMIGLVTPPVGLHLFITASIAKVPITSVIRESIPFMVVLLVVLGLVTFVPQISLFLPNLMK